MDKTNIEWTDATWNVTRGCSRVSEGCRHCYAEGIAARFSGPGLPYEGLARRTEGGLPQWTGEMRLVRELLGKPLSWTRPRRIFVNSMSDLFHEKLDNEAIAAVFGVMAAASHHVFQVLTKRPERMLDWFAWARSKAGKAYWGPTMAATAAAWLERREPGHELRTAAPDGLTLPSDVLWKAANRAKPTFPLLNVWLGVSVEDQATADHRIPLLLQTPAALRFISCEPQLARVDLQPWLEPGRPTAEGATPSLDWVIVGGESGPKARGFDITWARLLVAQCLAAESNVACFVKQLGSRPYDSTAEDWSTDGGQSRVIGTRNAVVPLEDPKGGTMDEWPSSDLRVREFPIGMGHLGLCAVHDDCRASPDLARACFAHRRRHSKKRTA